MSRASSSLESTEDEGAADKWKRVDFRRLRVHDWNACVAKLKRMQSEELNMLHCRLVIPLLSQVLDRDSLDPVLSKAKHLEAVQHVEVEVNSLQLVGLGEAFLHLRSLSAVITRKGPIAKGGAGERSTQRHPASLGGLSELLCATGLERLELSGAHGLALLPLTMPTHSLAQRCQHLRALVGICHFMLLALDFPVLSQHRDIDESSS
ncbi:hypothetical protein HPB51_017707 [Rhipicephalus microplus]|uniref:Uncharacterized protein n=1 Tax=Rhipicephalus microplus TaxID=6941 RepID=A0A9J6E366_RHIMP|nr:hypothetical protein HPB51_017707 [Rhipicephalus microplus]